MSAGYFIFSRPLHTVKRDVPRLYGIWLFRPFAVSPPRRFAPWLFRPLACFYNDVVQLSFFV